MSGMGNSALRRAALWFSVRNRRRKAAAITSYMLKTEARSLLMCGAVGSGSEPNEAIVEHLIAAHAETVLAFDVVDVGPQPWPFIVADGRDMPFANDEYDIVVANAVIEHVGDETDQRRFVAEHSRVGKSWVITTPNRWFPVEAHTSTILRHWSTHWREQRTEFTRLLSKREFAALLPEGAVIHGRPWSATFSAYYPGAPSRLALRSRR